jgi:L-rhamnonate dehydratase
MVDCYMSLDAAYAVEFARATEPYGLYWIEEALHPDDWEGYRALKSAAPWVRWVTGEHEYTRWGFRELIRHRAIDIVQPDLMWTGGFSEALRIASLASAFDVTVVPHAGGIYSYHYAMTQPGIPFVEYCNTSPRGDEITSVFGAMFEGEPVPLDGTITLSDAPGWGLRLNRDAVEMKRFKS